MVAPLPHRVACGLLVQGDRVLLMHRSPAKSWYPNVWDLPGGHLEPGETSGQALARELREELSIDIDPVSAPALLTLQTDALTLNVWRVIHWHGEVVNAAPEEHDAFGWFSLAETRALEVASAEYRGLFERVLAGPHG
jgi:mutator protein MutT